MKALIILGGVFEELTLSKNYDFVICVDKGYSYLEKLNIKCDLAVGDFDSLGYVPKNAVTVPKEKDFTDFELALFELKKRNIFNADCICGSGGREDHFICNLFTINKAFGLGIKINFLSSYGKMFLLDGKLELNLQIGTTISVLPLGESVLVDGVGFKYPYENLTITNTSSIGISNVVAQKNQIIEIKKGIAIIYIAKKLSV